MMAVQAKDLLRLINWTYMNTLIFQKCVKYTQDTHKHKHRAGINVLSAKLLVESIPAVPVSYSLGHPGLEQTHLSGC